ncbi:hypothetical protein GLOIN_2v1480509 [Rhizophagus clarus]|uniref:C2H2-type domain-containing protein n=1 Tax=Rhizophagus clarus TaxID=94130 RepID=A0A8H3MC82_9GLOM|nr:hypothetical protein GLOIN_2v1480509 [Rhizophagus clarus]
MSMYLLPLHTRQRSFKCPICTGLQFCSLNTLNQHLIFNHNDNFDSSEDTCDENKELNLAQVKDKNDVHVKKEGHKDEATAYTKGKDNNTTKLSYCDILIKDRNKKTEGKVAISLLPPKEYKEYKKYDLENHDNLPDML